MMQFTRTQFHPIPSDHFVHLCAIKNAMSPSYILSTPASPYDPGEHGDPLQTDAVDAPATTVH